MTWHLMLALTTAILFAAALDHRAPTVHDRSNEVKYVGFARSGIELFLNIKYGEDTGGENRFKAPVVFKPVPGTTYDATQAGPACPQVLHAWHGPFALGIITKTSEDCLNLNVARPAGKYAEKLPVMVWIHGGSFWFGSNMEPTTRPDGLIAESVKNGLPVIHVAMNYRLGVFGFAKSKALRDDASENAGLRDQRLAIEWVRDNIAAFGGDPNKITVFGSSSGGVSVGLHFLSFGGSKPLPFQQAICQSQCSEPGIYGRLTRYADKATAAVVENVGCNLTSVESPATIDCLRKLDTETLFDASVKALTDGEGLVRWLPTVDGDFLPAAPSQLLKEGKFGDVKMVMGWTDGDMNAYTPPDIASEEDTLYFIWSYVPGIPPSLMDELLHAYPSYLFRSPKGSTLSPEFFRAARILRDIAMVCPPLYFADSIHNKHNTTGNPNNVAFLYDFNQTILDPILEKVSNLSHLGAVHTSELPYVFGNFSPYNILDYPFNPTPQDHLVLQQVSRSWSAFASTASLSAENKTTLQGWQPAHVFEESPYSLYLIGGPYQSFTPIDGLSSVDQIDAQLLPDRCKLINSPSFILWSEW